MTALTDWGKAITRAALPLESIPRGPWRGAMESRSADQVPPEYAAGAGSSNFLYLPRTGTWKRRGGQVIQFDSATAPAGLLPAKWGGKARQLEEFISDSVSDGIPTVMALVTKETIVSGLDDGRFSSVWVRDRVGNVNYTLGSEYDGATYPALGAAQNYRVTPLWYESGDGGMTRGVTEFARRFFVSGSRRFLKVGNWWYFPSLRGTPSRWNGVKAGAVLVNRLIPSGPLPPTHAGSLAPGNLVVGAAASAAVRPDADVTDGSWLNQAGSAVNLYQSIDEVVADSTDYIRSPDPVVASRVGLGNLGFVPAADSTIKIVFKALREYPSTSGSLTARLFQGAVQKATSGAVLLALSGQQFSYTLTPAEIAAITDWNDLSLDFDGGVTAGSYIQVTHAALTYAPPGSAAEGSWKGSDRFLYSVAYRFEDGSVWMPCTPRLPGPDLPDGFNMFTVDANNPTAQYDFIKWRYLPIGVHGTTRICLRSLKVDSAEAGHELKLNPYDLRVVWELTDNAATEYIDYQADDFGLAEDSSGAFIRYDHVMPPRSRYIAGGDMRIVHAYGGRNPCAIEIAPVGRVADYDLNLPDSAATAYTSNASYMRVRYEAVAGAFLDLAQSNGAAITDLLSISLATYDTLQKLVDRINATSCAVNGQQWRAQLCPGANPAAPSATCLTPHMRKLTAGTVTANGSALITRAAGGLSVVAVGTSVTGTGIPTGAYVLRIDSDLQLTMSVNATAANADTIEFETRTGDIAATGSLTYQRVIANSAPGFLYFNAAYLNADPIDKSSAWMTVATPGSMKSAANSWSGKNANRFKPPTNAGISMGAAACDQGFVLPFSTGVYALRNTRDSSSGIDEDYKLVELNANRGCIAWNTVTPGPRFVPYLTPEGLCCADLEREYLLSEAPFLHAPPAGSLAYEITQCVAATAMDSDGAYASARVLRSAIWLNYRASGAHPNRQLVLDFSSGHVSNGLEALFRKEGEPWGWSVTLVRSLTAMCEGRRADGGHLYGWNDLNEGTGGAVNGAYPSFITYADERVTLEQVYVQKVSSAGVPAWTANGVAVSASTSGDTLTTPDSAVLGLSDGGCVVLYRENLAGVISLRANRFDTNGAKLWGATGVLVITAAVAKSSLRVISDTAGGFYFAWATGAVPMIRRCDSAGAMLWAALQCATTTAVDGVNQILLPDGSGGAYLAWVRYDSGFDDSTLFAQRIAPGGTLTWAAGGVNIGYAGDSPATTNYRAAVCVESGSLVALLPVASTRIGVIATRRNPATGAATWTTSNLHPTMTLAEDENLLIAPSTGGNMFLVWEDRRATENLAQVAMINSAGVLQWGPITISTLPFNSSKTMRAIEDGSGGLLILTASEAGTGLAAVKVSATGTLPWVNPVTVATLANQIVDRSVVTDGDGGMIVYFREDTASDVIRAARVRSSGVVEWTANGVALTSGLAASSRFPSQGSFTDAVLVTGGDGRIDEFEVGDFDNGVAIAAEVRFPWERIGKHKLSAQEVIIEHAAPVGAVVALDFHRSYLDQVFSLTLSPTAQDIEREVKLLPQAARAVTAAVFIGYRQTSGPAAELRAVTLRAKAVPSYK